MRALNGLTILNKLKRLAESNGVLCVALQAPAQIKIRTMKIRFGQTWRKPGHATENTQWIAAICKAYTDFSERTVLTTNHRILQKHDLFSQRMILGTLVSAELILENCVAWFKTNIFFYFSVLTKIKMKVLYFIGATSKPKCLWNQMQWLRWRILS